MKYDLVVRNGRAVIAGIGVADCDIAVRDGRIAGILGAGSGTQAAETIDAKGLIVFPGVIDAHVHFGLGSPDDYDTEPIAAARGGVTTVLNYIHEPESYLEVVPADRAKADRVTVVDYGIHPILMNEQHLDEIPRYVGELGVTSFKYFTNFKGQEGAYAHVQGTDTGFFYELCRRVATHPEVVLAVHTENIEVVWRLAAQLKAEGRDGLPAWTDSRPDFVEALDMFTAFLFAERTGARIYVPHLSSAAGLQIFRDHRARGGRSYIETCPHYLTLTAQSDANTLAKVNPPLRSPRDVEALWEAVADGTVSVVGSDHNSRPRAKKQGSIWQASAGFPGVATLLPLMLHEGHHKRGIPLERLAEVLAENPARIFELYPRKGAIAPGADADFTLIDLKKEKAVDSKTFGSRSDYSIWDGWKLRGWPVAAVLRGTEIMRENEILVPPGFGRFIRRPAAVPELTHS